MQTLSNELKGVIARRLEAASAREVLTIASALCEEDAPQSMTAQPVKLDAVSRFEVRDDIVCDRETGLMWSRSNVSGSQMEWGKAKEAASSLTLGGFTDWRLPTIKELLTLVDYDRHEPAIDTSAFNCEAAWYWSSTHLKSSPGDCAWSVGFDDGSSNWSLRNGNGFVRAVRVGQF